MKIKDLLEQLKNIDPDTSIDFRIQDGCCGDMMELNLINEKVVRKLTDSIYYVSFDFEALPGYYTCMQASSTIQRHNKKYEDKPEKQYPPK